MPNQRNGATPRCIVIGAGMAGITAAHTLKDAGWNVTVLEKSRAIGGRLSTRRTQWGAIDHGAQYVTAKGKPFRALMTGLSNAGSVAIWEPDAQDRKGEWHVGQGGMRHLLAPLADGLDIRFEVTVTQISAKTSSAHVMLEDGSSEACELAIIAVPSPQALKLTGGASGPFSQLAEVTYTPCYAGLFVFGERLDLPDVLRPDGDIAWAARCNSKPGGEGKKDHSGKDRWVVHGSPAWSRQVLETDKMEMAQPIQAKFGEAVEMILPEPLYARAHRWRYSMVETAWNEPFLLDASGHIGVIGDGMLGGRVEAAFESARQFCDHIKAR
ncbi:MAG: FAD-dependent oxidoreductase [Pseudomonadota bacterium]